MDTLTLETPPDWTPADDRADYLARFPYDRAPERQAGGHIEEALDSVHAVLDAILTHLQAREGLRSRVGWATLNIGDKCAALRWAFSRATGPIATRRARFLDHLDAVVHYDRERARLLQQEFRAPGSLALVNLADIADTLMTAAMELDEAMCVLVPGFVSAIR